MKDIEKELSKYEYLNERLFNTVVIDIIMSKDNITEEEAIEVINNLQIEEIDFLLEDNSGASLRKGIIETLYKLGYYIEHWSKK